MKANNHPAPVAEARVVVEGRLPLLIVDPARFLDAAQIHELGQRGFHVLCSGSGNAALQSVAARAPRLVLADASLPDMPLAS